MADAGTPPGPRRDLYPQCDEGESNEALRSRGPIPTKTGIVYLVSLGCGAKAPQTRKRVSEPEAADDADGVR